MVRMSKSTYRLDVAAFSGLKSSDKACALHLVLTVDLAGSELSPCSAREPLV